MRDEALIQQALAGINRLLPALARLTSLQQWQALRPPLMDIATAILIRSESPDVIDLRRAAF